MIVIKAIAEEHHKVAGDLLAVHGISITDMVAAQELQARHQLSKQQQKHSCSISSIGDEKASLKVLSFRPPSSSMPAYGKATESCTSRTDCRIKMWRTKTANSGTSSLKLCSLPPTSDSFFENVLRCHLQVATRKAALEEFPPNMDPTKYGWQSDDQGIMVPRTVPDNRLCAPPEILKLIHYKCKASGCLTNVCSCSKQGCTIFCL